jgi:hypothetical protein
MKLTEAKALVLNLILAGTPSALSSLMGANEAFRKKQVRVHQPLDSHRLYLLSHGDEKPLEVAPLIRIIRGPRTGEPACYFYNRIKDGGIRWVSYHFHAESEIVLIDEYVKHFISELSRD